MPTPALSGWRESALSRPGPAWNEELAAASRRSALAAWKSPKASPLPAAARATSAIWVESAGGMPTSRRTTRAVIAIVSTATIASVSTSVPRAKRRRSSASSCPSCPMAVAGASVPVASAMATGNESRTASTAGPCGPVTRGWP